MNPEDVLELVRRHVHHHRVFPTRHARERMEERKITSQDLRRLLLSAKTAVLQQNGCWRLLGGVDQDGDAATVVISLRETDSTLVVTVLE